MPTPRTFGANLRAARTAAGLTQDRLARILGFKRTTPISIWERSATVPEPRTIAKLAEGIGCPTAALLRGVVTPYDALRGATRTVDADADPDVDPYTAEQRYVIALLAVLGEETLRAAIAYYEATIRSAGLVLPAPAVPRDGRYTRRRGARTPAPREAAPTPTTPASRPRATT